ncbi:zinc-dependent alcohol dehydrogenase family protein [Pseudomonadota bacterium]
MKLIEFFRHGTPHEVCRCVDAEPLGEPGSQELLVDVDASAINPADLLIIQGRYPGPEHLPAAVGIEGVGTIKKIGDGVSSFESGDRVLILGRANWAQQVMVPQEQAIKLPFELDILQAAQLKANPPTAKLMLENYLNLKPGDWIIQNAANSAVGQHIIRIAHNRGLKTVNVVRRTNLVEPLSDLGADLVVVGGKDLSQRVRTSVGDARLLLAIDAIGGEDCLQLADCLSDNGVVVNYGFLSGEPCKISPHQAILHGISLQGFWLVKSLFQTDRANIENTYAEIAELFMSGVLNSPVEACYPLEQVTEALTHAEGEGRSGKIVFTPNGPLA